MRADELAFMVATVCMMACPEGATCGCHGSNRFPFGIHLRDLHQRSRCSAPGLADTALGARMDPLYYALLAGAFTTVGLIVRMVLASLKHRGDRKFLRHVFDQTRRIEVLGTLEQLDRNAFADTVAAARPPGPMNAKLPEVGKGGSSPPQESIEDDQVKP